MHYHGEVVLPPSEDIEGQIRSLIRQFSEHYNEDSRFSFYDYWEIGGRYSGSKMEANLGKDNIEAFSDWLTEKKVTVSAVRFGKQTLEPASQRQLVDTEWSRRFPEFAGACPFFDHFDGDVSDICTVAEVPAELTCFTLIIADKPDWADKLVVVELLHKEIWNGVSMQKTDFDGNVLKVLQERKQVQDDWLVVTIDYHS